MKTITMSSLAAVAACYCLSLTTIMVAAFDTGSNTASTRERQYRRQPQQSVMTASNRVDVVIGVMSRCPDAVYFEGVFDRVLPQVNSKISLTMAYIAQEDRSEPTGFSCKHGSIECEGNIQQLCVIDALDPDRASERFDIGYSEAQKLWWNFLQCENFVGGIKHIGEEGVARQCVDALGKFPKWKDDGIKDCVEGQRGRKLLEQSISTVKANDIVKSATLVIEGEIVCIRDGGEWKDCPAGHEVADFVRQIDDAYAKKNDMQEFYAARSVPVRAQLTKRQTSSSGAPEPSNSNQQQGQQTGPQQGAPLSVFTFIIAIALFVLVVSFVLLRIFVRNRRLRRLGIYPETPLERLLGTIPREYDDNLPPPKLWEAKIADVRAYNNGEQEQNATTRAPDVSLHRGWDALMPLSAALPPSLYPILYHQSNSGDADVAASGAPRQQSQAAGLPALSSSTGARISRRMPNLFRRATGDVEQVPPGSDATEPARIADGTVGDANTAVPDMDEKLSASVNVTVLIAMPSPKTTFPFNRKTVATSGTARSHNGSTSAVPQLDKVHDVDEWVDADDSSSKGKAKRAASIRSIRTATSTKSQADARREAFFKAEEEQQPVDLSSVEMPPARSSLSEENNVGGDKDDEEDLPELVFGTASVPLYARIGTPSGSLPPSRDEVLRLVASAADAKKSKAALRKSATTAKTDEEDAGRARDTQLSSNPQNGTQDSSILRRSSDVYEMEDLGPGEVNTGSSARNGARNHALSHTDLAPIVLSSRV